MSPDRRLPHPTTSTGPPSWMAPVMPVVPDHELVRRIGGGSYGDVWLARTAVGAWRAVKVVFRDRFTDTRPYEREFHGIQKFEPLSRANEAFVDILQIGRNDVDGYFYYVMELADDLEEDRATNAESGIGASARHYALRTPDIYTPCTLSRVLLQRGRLPVRECVELGLTLNLGLAQLHKAGLIHRDIKPSNIIFVGGVPKLADIGLVTEMSEARSFVGTEGFIPPEGPNSPQADLYSLGKVLYEAGMGKDRKDFPEPYTQIADAPDATQLLEFNAILLKACAASREERYQSAEEMNADLALLQSGGSVRLQRKLAGQLRFVQRAGALVTVLAAVIALGWWWQAKQTRIVRELAEENLNLARRADDHAKQAKMNELAARERLYAADINGAHKALQADNLRLARSLLQTHLPQPGQTDLRGFEWRYLWERCRSQELLSLQGHTNDSRVFTLAPDGRRIVVGGVNGTANVVDLQLRREIASLSFSNRVLSLSYSPAGDLLTVGTSTEVCVLDGRSFAELRRLPSAAAPAVLSPDGKTLLTGKRLRPEELKGAWKAEQTLMVWDTANWSVIHSTSLPASGPASIARDLYLQVAFGTTSSRLAVLVGDTVRLLRFPDLVEIAMLPDKIPIKQYSRPFIALASDNRTLAIPGQQGFEIRLWDLRDMKELRILTGHTDMVIGAAFSPDGTMLATCSPDQTVRLWNVETGELLNTLSGHADEVFDVAFSADGKLLASLGCYDAVVKLWDPNTRPRREEIRKPRDRETGTVPVGFDGMGGLAAFVWPGMQPAVLDLASLESTSTRVPVCKNGVRYYLKLGSVSANGQYQGLWAVDDRVLEIWSRHSGKLLCSLPSLSPEISFDHQRQLVATITTNSAGAYCRTIWQLPQGTAKWVVTNASSLRIFAGDGQHLFTEDETQLQMWRIEGDGLKPSLAVPNNGGWFTDAVASPDGRFLATTGGDITIRELPSGAVIGVLKGHTRKGPLLAFSPDGRTLASIADDRTVRLWHMAAQRELLQFQTPNEDRGSFWLEFSPDGRALAASRVDDDGDIAWLYYAPSFAEIAVTEGRDYRAEAGDDPITWLAVAKALMRKERWLEANDALDEVLNRTADRDDLAWFRTNTIPQRLEVLKHLNRFEKAGADK